MIKENNKTNKHKNRNKRQQKMKTQLSVFLNNTSMQAIIWNEYSSETMTCYKTTITNAITIEIRKQWSQYYMKESILITIKTLQSL